MAYATQQDIIDRKGSDALLIAADRDNDDVVDVAAVSTALDDATDEINAYVGKRESLPLPTVPKVLVRICVDIAIYRLSEETAYTDEKRKRYEDAIATLRRIASGEISLGINNSPQETIGQEAELISPPRQFNRNNMQRLT